MSQEKKVYNLKCARCERLIESYTEPGPKISCFLCNSCALGWKEKQDKLLGHTYEDEMRKAFIEYVNTKPWTFNNKKVI